MKFMLVKNARKAFETTKIEGFAAEMGISVEDAQYVRAYIQRNDVCDDSIVILEETIIDGEKIGAGNRKL